MLSNSVTVWETGRLSLGKSWGTGFVKEQERKHSQDGFRHAIRDYHFRKQLEVIFKT